MDTLSHLMPFKRCQTFDPGSRPWYPYSIRFPRIIWYLACQAIYFPSSMPSSHHHTSMSAALIQLLMLSCLHGLSLATWSESNNMPLCHPSWTSDVWHMDAGHYLNRSDPRCHRHFCCVSCTLVYTLLLTMHLFYCAASSCLGVNVTSWQSSHCQELHTITIGLN